MAYEIVYYCSHNNLFSKEETDTYTIFEVNDAKTEIRIHSQYRNGQKVTALDNEWFDYDSCGYEKELTEEEVFTHCL